MTDTATPSVPERGRFRRALATVGAYLEALDSSPFDYTHDRIGRLERELGQLKEEMRQSPAHGAIGAGNPNAAALER